MRRHALLLTDLHMPGMDGYSLAAAIRSEEPDGSRMPIVALSANALHGELDRCRAAGMDDYLSKPVRTEALGDMVKRWLPPENTPIPTPFEAVDCEEMDVFDVELGHCAYDDQALERLVGDDPALLADFRQRFVVAALSTMDEMRRAASRTDMATLADLAHRLKSSGRAIGAVSLAACCERIERAGSICSTTEMHRHMASMEDALADVMTRLSSHTGLQHTHAAPDSNQTSPSLP
jgi:CheY-like chemotaxis protein